MKKKIDTMFNTILVFKDGEMIRQIQYNTKKETIINYRGFCQTWHIRL